MKWSKAIKEVKKGNKVSHPGIYPMVIVHIEDLEGGYYITFDDGYSCPDGELFKYRHSEKLDHWDWYVVND